MWRTAANAHYRPHLSRHAWNLFANGFYTKGLDSEDFDFLERVRRHGCANSSEPRGDTTLIDELEFWHFPYTVDPSVVRRVGPYPKPPKETPAQEMARKARVSIWHMRRAVTEQDKLVAEAELKRELIEWEQAEQRRKWGRMVDDAEWEAAAPRIKRLAFGAVINQHYVPQWKLDELGFDQAFEEALAEDAEREEAVRIAQEEAIEERRLLDERVAHQIAYREALQAEATRRRVALEAALAAQKQEHAERLQEELRQRLEVENFGDMEPIKRVIRTMVRTGPFNIDMLGAATGQPRHLLQAALDEMVRDRELRMHQRF